jgi:hypothetical protein
VGEVDGNMRILADSASMAAPESTACVSFFTSPLGAISPYVLLGE